MIPATPPSPSGLPALGGDPLSAVVLSELPMSGPVARDPQPGGFAAQLAASRQPWDAAGEATPSRSARTAPATEDGVSLAPASPWPKASTLALGAAWPAPAEGGEAQASASSGVAAAATVSMPAAGASASARSPGVSMTPPQVPAPPDAAPDDTEAALADQAPPLPAGAGPLAAWLAQWTPPAAATPSYASTPPSSAPSVSATAATQAGTPLLPAAGESAAAPSAAGALQFLAPTMSPETAPNDGPSAGLTVRGGEAAGERPRDRAIDLRTPPVDAPPAGSEPTTPPQAAARETDPDRAEPSAASPMLPPAGLPFTPAPAAAAATPASTVGAATAHSARPAPTAGGTSTRAGAERNTVPNLSAAEPADARPSLARGQPAWSWAASGERPSGPKGVPADPLSPSPAGSSTTAAGTAPAAPPAALPARGWATALAAGDPPILPLGLPGSEALPRLAERPAAAPALDAALGPAASSGLGALAAPPAGPTETPSVALSTPVLAPEFREALGVQVSLLARDGIEQAELQLNPVDMGPIAIRIELDGQQAQISFGVEHPQTRAIVEASLPELASALRDAGLTLTGGGVSEHPRGQAGGAAAGGPGGGSGGEHPPRPDHARHGRGDAAGERAPEPNPRSIHRLVGAGGIDLYA